MCYAPRVNFHPDDFLSLIEEVEAQGGVHLTSEACTPPTFRLNQPINPEDPNGPKRNIRIEMTGCHRRAKFLVPLLPDAYLYDRDELHTQEFDFNDQENPVTRFSDGAPALAKVCAVDDAMGLWPRFQDAMHTGSSFQE